MLEKLHEKYERWRHRNEPQYDFTHDNVPEEYKQYIPLMERLESGETVDFTNVPYDFTRWLGKYYEQMRPLNDIPNYLTLMHMFPDGNVYHLHHRLSGLPPSVLMTPEEKRYQAVYNVVMVILKLIIVIGVLTAPWLA